MKIIALFFTLLLSALGNAQDFNGYYITTKGETVRGFFKNGDFSNPESLQFKKTAGEAYAPLPVDGLTEFGIEDQFKYEKHTVKVDNTNLASNRPGENKEVTFTTHTLFLNVLVEGDASLYSHTGDMGTKYFYSVKSKDVAINQLIYKKYSTGAMGLAENNQYKQQLYTTLVCGEQNVNNFTGIRYNASTLSSAIQRYNQCVGSTSSTFGNKAGRKAKVNYIVFAGLYSTSFSISDSGIETNTSSEMSYGGGIEAALTLASEKFTFFARAEYEKVNHKVTSVNVGPWPTLITTTSTYDLDASIINIYMGPRYNLLLGTKHKFYIDVAAAMAIPTGSLDVTRNIKGTTINETDQGDFNLNGGFYGNFGIGYVFNNKFGVDFRFDTNRSLLRNAYNITNTLNRMGINLRYTIN
jgi:hypothetical protein